MLSQQRKVEQESNTDVQPMKYNQRVIGDYSLVRTIGVGTFGQVKLAIHQLTNEKVAIKILDKSKIVEIADVERVSREIHILKLIRHKHVIQLYEIIETRKYIFLVMEFADGGEFFDYIVNRKKLAEMEASRIFQELISGIEYIHQLGIVHRDLKPENLLLDFNNSIKIVDFGLSNTYSPGEQLKTACGSPCYAAPEMIAGQKYDSQLVDIWSCGVILFASICGYLPFEDADTPALYKKILSGEYYTPPFMSKDCVDFIAGILKTDPNERMNIAQIKSHRWFNLYKRKLEIPFGIVVGYNSMPIDQKIVQLLTKKGFSADYITTSLDANKHNNVTAAYFLLLKKDLMQGGQSNADINSSHFNTLLLKPKQRPVKRIQYHNVAIINELIETQLMQPLIRDRSKSYQPKAYTQQSNRGASVPLVVTEKQHGTIQNHPKSPNYSQIYPKVRTFSIQHKADQHPLNPLIQDMHQTSRSPKHQNFIAYLQTSTKCTPISVRGQSQEIVWYQNSLKQKQAMNQTSDKLSMGLDHNQVDSKYNKQNQGKKKQLRIPHEDYSMCITKPQTTLGQHTCKGSRDLSVPSTTKITENPKKGGNTDILFIRKDKKMAY